MDNAGENKKLEETCKAKQWQLPLKFEYTARATPQQNSVVEKKFNTLASRARATMSGANIPPEIRKHVCKECINCCTHIDGLIVRKSMVKLKPDMNIGVVNFPSLQNTCVSGVKQELCQSGILKQVNLPTKVNSACLLDILLNMLVIVTGCLILLQKESTSPETSNGSIGCSIKSLRTLLKMKQQIKR